MRVTSNTRIELIFLFRTPQTLHNTVRKVYITHAVLSCNKFFSSELQLGKTYIAPLTWNKNYHG